MSNGNGHRWSKFWWQDWQNDQDLKLCSLAAQGLWMRMLCIMHDNGGYLLLGGEPPDETQLARLIGAHWREVKTLLAELLRRQVCSKNASGVIYSRRMCRDLEASLKGQEFAEKRWKGQKTPHRPNGGANGEAKGEPTPTPNARSLEAEERSTEELRSSAPSGAKTAAEILWSEGGKIVRQLLAVDDDRARRFLGTLLKATENNDHTLVLAKLRECQQLGPIDPPAWLIAAVRPFRGQLTKPKYRNAMFAVIENDAARSPDAWKTTLKAVGHGN